ncbi:MAG: porin family protein [Tannerella sp.]|jgi:putative salt-induced outer membrane protein YdiY|nr:porin family protein [Tannerella sp.]
MKKILFTLAIACSSMCISAQMYVGGSLGFNHNNDKESDYKTTSVNILPEVGYAFNDKWSIGTTVGYSKYKVDRTDNYKTSDRRFTFSPYARYSFLRKNIFSLFVDGGPNIRFQKDYYYNGSGYTEDEDWTTYLGLAISPGVSVKVCDNLSILAHLGALRYIHSDDVESFDFSLSNSLSFGVFYSF